MPMVRLVTIEALARPAATINNRPAATVNNSGALARTHMPHTGDDERGTGRKMFRMIGWSREGGMGDWLAWHSTIEKMGPPHRLDI